MSENFYLNKNDKEGIVFFHHCWTDTFNHLSIISFYCSI